uniref:Uncharacterized protein n=1 Tax=Rhipicephalus microplus TaxID=6941 RepID=A0A6G5AFQ8_RHIMP
MSPFNIENFSLESCSLRITGLVLFGWALPMRCMHSIAAGFNSRVSSIMLLFTARSSVKAVSPSTSGKPYIIRLAHLLRFSRSSIFSCLDCTTIFIFAIVLDMNPLFLLASRASLVSYRF